MEALWTCTSPPLCLKLVKLQDTGWCVEGQGMIPVPIEEDWEPPCPYFPTHMHGPSWLFSGLARENRTRTPVSSMSGNKPASIFPCADSEPPMRHPLTEASWKPLQCPGCSGEPQGFQRLPGSSMCRELKAIPAPFPFLTLPLLRLIQLEKSLLLPPLPVPSPCHLSPAQRHLHSSAPVAFLLKVLLCTS